MIIFSLILLIFPSCYITYWIYLTGPTNMVARGTVLDEELF